MKPAVRVSGVLETCLYATDLERTGRFYEDVLGLVAFARAEGRHIFFRAGDGVFLLFNPARTAAGDGAVPPHGGSGPGHVAFAVTAAELEALPPLLEARGVHLEADVHWPGGGRSLYLRDPAGNSVELTTPSIWGSAGVGEFSGRPGTG